MELRVERSEAAWLFEPESDDPTWAKSGESTTDWLARSTLWRARMARTFLRLNIAHLPESWQRGLCWDLQNRWHTAFFELIVARTLQVSGATELCVESADETGRKPDFLAAFRKCRLVIEATTPEFLREHNEHSQRVSMLKQMIEDAAPEGWSIAIVDLPEIGFNESKREFKRAVSSLLKLEPPTEASKPMDLEAEVSAGTIMLKVVPGRLAHTAVVAGPAFASWSDSVDRIRKAIKVKRAQVRSSAFPAILAINGSFSATLGDFDRALFGSADRMDGEFAQKRDGDPTFAGVLLYEEVGFTCPREPVLFLHPRYRSELPEELRAFETRRLVEGNRVEVTGARRLVLKDLDPIDLSLERAESDD